jgi:hypothetical protein
MSMSFYGKRETWKIVYILPPHLQNNGARGVALIEACDQHHAMSQFQQQYAGQFFTVESCQKLLG